jgi:small subunit ribosomal protein S1
VTELEPTVAVQALLNSVKPGEARRGTVAGFDGFEVVVDLGDSTQTHRAAGRIVRHELSWRRTEDPAEIVSVGQTIR